MTNEAKRHEEEKKPDRPSKSQDERAKELNCLYRIGEILRAPNVPLENVCHQVIEAIPTGWLYPEICQVRITVDEMICSSADYKDVPQELRADIVVQNNVVGNLCVSYREEKPTLDDGPFLKEESKLIHTIAERLGLFITTRRLDQVVREWESASKKGAVSERVEWRVMLKMLTETDLDLYNHLSTKMLNHLCWSGVEEAVKHSQSSEYSVDLSREQDLDDWNRPHQRRMQLQNESFNREIFEIASRNLSDEKILGLIQKWLQEEKLSFLVQVLNRDLLLSEVGDVIRRYYHLPERERYMASQSLRGVKVALIRRFLSTQLEYINIAKEFVEVADFYHLFRNTIFTSTSHGRLGGKTAGLFLATQILKKKGEEDGLLRDVRVPKTWYISSDVLDHFMHYNNFEEVVEQKYKEIDQVRQEYPHIVRSFKNARFPEDIVKGLSVALDDFGDHPLIVRSSSLLEDSIGAAFSGKYKSLFVANQGSKEERLKSLMDAIAEVYASTFGPDPIEYRAERGLLDFKEEMGAMIQEVIGTKVDKYFLPAYAGVAFSNNEFRWSPRIKRKDGLIRLVPGLGTRAVDRTSDDYPILIAPGQPGLKVNITADEIFCYSPKKIDVINLETNSFETMDLAKFLREVGMEYPSLRNIVSIYEGDLIRRISGINFDLDRSELIANFEGLIESTPFVRQVHAVLKTLEETLGTPIDIEFASDGSSLYLLQCRAQSYSEESRPAPIPQDIPGDKIVFSADRFISNGQVTDITHILYVDPQRYGAIENRADLLSVGRAVSRLNKILPKRQFILMGPGRWGSRGDIKLGVSVTYSDINNTAMLIEIARKKGAYVPDLSFGTHFFQDLVEANIRYLPLHPDDEGIIFNERFLLDSSNILHEILPEFAHLSDTLRLIDVPENSGGMVLRVLMNADLGEAVAILSPPGEDIEVLTRVLEEPGKYRDTYWRWRMTMLEQIASQLDPDRFGVVALYVFGSTKNATAGPKSDIDIIVHFRGTPKQCELLLSWLEGWSLCLDQMNYMRTGYRTGGLLDVHLVTDEDIEKKTSYAAKIGAVTDAARPILLTWKES